MNKIKKIIYAAVIFIIVSVMQLNNVNATEMVNSKEVDISVETDKENYSREDINAKFTINNPNRADKNNKILISNEINLFLFFLSIVKYIAINITTVIITNHIIIWCESPVCGLTLLPLYTYFNSYDFS